MNGPLIIIGGLGIGEEKIVDDLPTRKKKSKAKAPGKKAIDKWLRKKNSKILVHVASGKKTE